MVPSSGAQGSPIIFGAYGVGNMPKISGANLLSGWSLHKGSTFKTATAPVRPNQVFMDSERLSMGASPETLNDKDWFWTEGVLYLRNDIGNPGEVGKAIEASQRDYCILLDYPGVKNFVVIDAIFIEKANSIGIFVGSALNGFTVKNSVMQFCYYDGLKVTGGTEQNNGVIRGNITRLNGKNGIKITGRANSWIIEGNTSYDNCQVNDSQHNNICGGVYIWGNNSNLPNIITSMVIQNNELYRNGIVSPTEDRGVGIWLDDCGKGNIVRYNSVYNNNSHGIFLEATSDSEVYYNLVYANKGANQYTSSGIHVKGNGGRKANNNFVSNNTLYNNWAGIAVQTFGDNSQVVNNLIINNISVGNVKDLFADLGGDNDGIRGSGNIYQHNSFGAERAGFIRWGKTNYSSYAPWESAYGGPTYSVKSDPQLVNPTLGNFKLQSSSPCIDAGTKIGLAQDYAGIILPQGNGVDIGALEFVPATRIAPPQDLKVNQTQ